MRSHRHRLTCRRRRSLRPGCCNTAGPQRRSTPDSPDPSVFTCCTGGDLATLSSPCHHTLVFQRLQIHRHFPVRGTKSVLGSRFGPSFDRVVLRCFCGSLARKKEWEQSMDRFWFFTPPPRRDSRPAGLGKEWISHSNFHLHKPRD